MKQGVLVSLLCLLAWGLSTVPGAHSASAVINGLTQAQHDLALDLHNQYRSTLGASNMEKMVRVHNKPDGMASMSRASVSHLGESGYSGLTG